MIYEIKQEGVWANYEFVKIASDTLQKKIILYKNHFENPDVFDSDIRKFDSDPLRILFIGQFDNGHIKSISLV